MAVISVIDSNTDESARAWPPGKYALTDPVFPASGRKAEPRETQAEV